MITDLKQLWKQAFGDTDAFIDAFFTLAYRPERCMYLTEDNQLAAMLYWFDCSCREKKLAYLYAVATEKAFQNRGFCHRLMEQTHNKLKLQGYAGAILVPGSEALFRFYEKMGYRTCSWVQSFTCCAGKPTPLRSVDVVEYAALRRAFLPESGVVQEGAALTLLAETAAFYAGDDFVLTATTENGIAHVHELLGNADPAGITAALGAETGHIRTPAADTPFAMYRSFDGTPAPGYFGLALD